MVTKLIRVATLYAEPGLLEQLEQSQTPAANSGFDCDHDPLGQVLGLLDANGQPIFCRLGPATLDQAFHLSIPVRKAPPRGIILVSRFGAQSHTY